MWWILCSCVVLVLFSTMSVLLLLSRPPSPDFLPHMIPSVSVATTAPLNLLHPPLYVDGVLTRPRMRVLVKNQLVEDENGVYAIDEVLKWNLESRSNASVWVEQGIKYASTLWLKQEELWRKMFRPPVKDKYILTYDKWVPRDEGYLYREDKRGWSACHFIGSQKDKHKFGFGPKPRGTCKKIYV